MDVFVVPCKNVRSSSIVSLLASFLSIYHSRQNAEISGSCMSGIVTFIILDLPG